MSKREIVRNHPLARQLSYYLGFNFLVLFWHLILISLIAFFHFLLDHRLAVIEDWIFEQGWEILIISKLLSCGLFIKFINLRSEERRPIRSLLARGFIRPKRESLVALLALFLITILFGKPVDISQTGLLYPKLLMAYIGTFLFFMADILLLQHLQEHFPLRKASFQVRTLLFPVILTMVTMGSLVNEKGPVYLLYFHFFMSLYLARWGGKNWTLPAIYLLVFASPMSSFFGLDPIWGESFSWMKMTSTIGMTHMFALGALMIFYLQRKQKTDRFTRVNRQNSSIVG